MLSDSFLWHKPYKTEHLLRESDNTKTSIRQGLSTEYIYQFLVSTAAAQFYSQFQHHSSAFFFDICRVSNKFQVRDSRSIRYEMCNYEVQTIIWITSHYGMYILKGFTCIVITYTVPALFLTGIWNWHQQWRRHLIEYVVTFYVMFYVLGMQISTIYSKKLIRSDSHMLQY